VRSKKLGTALSETYIELKSQLSHCRMRQPLMRRMRQHVQRTVAGATITRGTFSFSVCLRSVPANED
jgi:hypothetical protein